MIGMKISILMPVYNAAKYLPETLNSIRLQSEENWELWAVDDFSEDDSYAILSDFALKDTRIRVLKNKEKGIIPALNLAFQHSNGHLITRMDADDLMMPKKLESLKSFFLKNETGIIATGSVEYFSEAPMGSGYLKYEKWLNSLTASQTNFSEVYKECVIPSPCWMICRKDLIRCGAFDHQTYPEDYDLCFRFYKNQLKVVSCPQILHRWRDHPARSSRTMEQYSNNHYFDLKLPYFLEIDRQEQTPLVLWGAGKKGKKLAKMLYTKGVPFQWVCNNPNKWGIELWGTKMNRFQHIETLVEPQIIIAVGAPDGQLEIKEYLQRLQFNMEDCYFFT